jgi:hypothetical protein
MITGTVRSDEARIRLKVGEKEDAANYDIN